ncbi:MFS transporter [Sphingosinicella sp. BN140058]|uniref:MFS transporter n=1 Tax=Sphingosinicella sp. BN140058 TaxID=1892855 RepID=UPI0010115A04|nr:MFS transporter [Sphingosinicella sp. BN140058]QAY78962.1 MFS transporter [Sphingosinicella sp. BN140058]
MTFASVTYTTLWAPLRSRVFAVLWCATLIGNIGAWIREVGSGWLMTELAPSPLMVALVQAAGTLPLFLLSLPSGALSDLLDRRKLLIAVQVAMLSLAIGMAAGTVIGLMTPAILLLCVVAAGIGSAVSAPAWQALIPDLVRKEERKDAVALGSLGIARAIGPALGGALILMFGVAAPFFACAAAQVAVLAALLWWKRKDAPPTLPPEHLLPAIVAARRYAQASLPLRRTLVRTAIFFGFGSAPWALLPLFVRTDLGGSAGFYGTMFAAVGAGAIAGATALPRLRTRYATDRLVIAATFLLSAVSLALALTRHQFLALSLMPLLGGAWVTVVTALNITTQSILPDWVRGRGLALYLTVFNGAIAVGSLGWGQLADYTSTRTSLAAAAFLGAMSAIVAARIRLPDGTEDLTPSLHWPAPEGGLQPCDAGPVMITVEYRIPPERAELFAEAIEALGASRRRSGAYAWGTFRDTAVPDRYLEYFLVATWVEHLRQHRRVSHADEAIQASVRALHAGNDPPRVSHYLEIGRRESRTPSWRASRALDQPR